jgi:hypothetical protein
VLRALFAAGGRPPAPGDRGVGRGCAAAAAAAGAAAADAS